MSENWLKNEILAPYTTLRIGGAADYFLRVTTEDELLEAVKEARRKKLPVTILGWGSNVLISDKGIRGLVIKNETGEMEIGELSPRYPSLSEYGHFPPNLGGNNSEDIPRWQSDKTRGTFKYEFSDLNYDESDALKVRVTLSSGFSLPKAINELLGHGITGLQWFARIPGTIGGAVHNNIHGGTRFFCEFVDSVKILTKEGEVKKLNSKELGLAYDKSRFHDSDEIILSVTLNLFRGDSERAKAVAFEWAKRKSIQPPRSAGCTFKNISNEDKERLDFPTTSAAYIVEHVLGMSGYKVGGARISGAHHNFIVNDGGATAADYLAVMREVQNRTKEKLGIALESEIILLGDFS